MGCGSSKETVCRKCQLAYSPVRRAPPQKTGDSYHVVALNSSSTLGSLKLDPSIHVIEDKLLIGNEEIDEESVSKEKNSIEAKTCSKMINEKNSKMIPKTPITTPSGEPEMINAWEMMEGLEEITHLKDSSLSSIDEHHDTSIISKFDHEVTSTYRTSLEELPRADPFHLEPLNGEKYASQVKREKNVSRNKFAPRGVDKLTVYFTSLRGVRKTYEDCCHVRVILEGLRVKVDEKDVSMHSGFKKELMELSGEPTFRLPRVYLGEKCIGGAEEIRRLNEAGKLEKMVANCEMVNGGENGEVCEACGDIRFVPCETCSGSCKIYYDDVIEEECNGSEDECGFYRCPYCNENGIVRCPICCN